MLKNKTQLEAILNEKTYHFLCDMDSPLNHVRAALHQFLGFVDQIEESARKAQAEADEKLQEESKVEPLDPVKEKDGN